MEKLKRPILFTLVLLSLNFLLGYYYSNAVMSESLLMRSERGFYRDTGERIRYLVMGDSHVMRGVDPLILDRSGTSYNISTVGEQYRFTYYRLKHIIEDDGKKVENVILPMGLHTFSTRYSDEGMFVNNYFWSKYLDYFELGREMGKVPFFIQRGIEGHLIPYLRGYENFIRFFSSWHDGGEPFSYLLTGESSHPSRGGFVPKGGDYSMAADPMRVALGRASEFFKGRSPYDKNLIEYFYKTIELCERKGINIILVSMPVTKNFYSASVSYILSGDKAFDEFYIENEVRKRYGLHVLDSLIVYFDRDDLFFDSDHLNSYGAEVFSRRLGELIRASEGGGGRSI